MEHTRTAARITEPGAGTKMATQLNAPGPRLETPTQRAARIARRSLVGVGLLAVMLPAAACGYSAVVRNESTKTVVAEIRHDRFLAPESVPARSQLKPGESASLGPFKIDPLEPITLRVRVVGDVFGGWLEKRLEPGEQLFVVEDGTLESWEAILLRRVPMGGDGDEPGEPRP